MLRRKYELDEKHVYKLCDKQPKTVLNNLKKVTMENTIMNGILTEDINWNTLIRMIRKKRNSSEVIKLPLKVINSVVFKYL